MVSLSPDFRREELDLPINPRKFRTVTENEVVNNNRRRTKPLLLLSSKRRRLRRNPLLPLSRRKLRKLRNRRKLRRTKMRMSRILGMLRVLKRRTRKRKKSRIVGTLRVRTRKRRKRLNLLLKVSFVDLSILSRLETDRKLQPSHSYERQIERKSYSCSYRRQETTSSSSILRSIKGQGRSRRYG